MTMLGRLSARDDVTKTNKRISSGWRDRGIKAHKKGSRNVFYVLQNTSMPAVLTLNGFYTNKEETELLLRDDIRQLIADAHVAAILHIEQNGWENEPIHRPNMVLA